MPQVRRQESQPEIIAKVLFLGSEIE